MSLASGFSCKVCGASLKLRPQSCPLCGSETDSSARPRKPTDIEDYQANVRELRRRLKQLRSAQGG